MADDKQEALLKSIGFSGRLLTDTLANTKVLGALAAVLAEAGITAEIGASVDVGSLLYDVATKFPEAAEQHRALVIKYVVDGKLNRAQLAAALRYFKALGNGELNVAEFEKECGVGVNVTEAEIVKRVNAILDTHKVALEEKKHAFVTTIYGEVKKDDVLRWGDGKQVMATVDAEVVKRIGERPQKKEKGKAAPVKKEEKTAANAPPQVNEEELNPAQYRELRLKAVEEARQGGRTPYPHKFAITHEIDAFRTAYDHLKTGEQLEATPENLVRVAGRITLRRDNSAKLVFYTLKGAGTDVQILANYSNYADKKDFGKINELLRRGDIIGVEGVPARSKSGELSVVPIQIVLLSPCFHNMPLPESLTEMETRYRARYLDLLVNEEVTRTFKTRSKIIQFIRRFFDTRGFMEVETPTMNLLAGGATAKPFVTYHNDLHVNLFMRVAPELYLKELIIGGLEKVYEIGKNYRNEGIDLTHNPEFTAVESYQAYADYNDVMAMTEELLSKMVLELTGSYKVVYHHQGKDHGLERKDLVEQLSANLGVTFPDDLTSKDGKKFLDELLAQRKVVCRAPVTVSRQLDALALEFLVPRLEIDFTPPFKRIPMIATLEEVLQTKFPADLASQEATSFMKELCAKHQIICNPPLTNARLLDKLVGHFLEPQCVSPAFITDHPQMMSPLAKWHRSTPGLTERFELFVAGRELCNAYTELNDPQVQRKLFEGQSADRKAGDDEAQPIDEGFCTAMEFGLPPTGGWGLGIDRLVMFLTDQNNIKEVILFPAMKPLEQERAAQSQQLRLAHPAELGTAASDTHK